MAVPGSGASPEPGEAASTSVIQAVGGWLEHGLALVQVRAELLGIESQEALSRLIQVLAWLAVSLVALTLGLVFVSLWITVLLWDQHRLLVLTGLSVWFLTVAGIAGWRLRRLLHRAEPPFAATMAELQADRDRLAAALRRHRSPGS